MSHPIYVFGDQMAQSDLRILVGGLPNTGKSAIAFLFAEFLSSHGFTNVRVNDNEPDPVEHLKECERALLAKQPSIVIETIQVRRSLTFKD